MVNANSLSTNLLVTALVLLMVFVMPWADRRICRRLGLNLQGGVSGNPRADALLRLRQALLYGIFALYAAAVAYLAFFSRSATTDYQVHIALFEDLKQSVHIDLGFLGLLRSVFTEGVSAAVSHIRVEKAEDIAQVYMNIMLFVPMGYLLPYLFPWFRARVRIRPALACFLISLLMENLQLIFRRGFYDMDDLVSNTLGGILGQFLFLWVAYVVTHPDWRHELQRRRRWQKRARKRTLYPFARHLGLRRPSLLATREETVWDFFIETLGFRLVSQLVPQGTDDTDFLLEMGKMQVEIHCSNVDEALPPQHLTLSVRRLNPVLRRLRETGIQAGPVEQDPYTKLRCVRFPGPDSITVCIIEE
jgi:VanZ family protein